MKWQFNLTEGSKNINLKAEIVFTNYQIEEIKVMGDGISLLLLNNRPLLEAIELRQPLSWRVISGEVKDQNLLGRIKKELEKHLTKPATVTAQQPVPQPTAKPQVQQPAAKPNREAGKKAVRA